eukprot:scaffold170618_cov46-Cyclotella_meneghiniana.AAC.1
MSWMQLRGSPRARHRAIHLATRFDYWHELLWSLNGELTFWHVTGMQRGLELDATEGFSDGEAQGDTLGDSL